MNVQIHLIEPQGKLENMLQKRSLQQYPETLSSHWIAAFAKTRRRIYGKTREGTNPPDRTAR